MNKLITFVVVFLMICSASVLVAKADPLPTATINENRFHPLAVSAVRWQPSRQRDLPLLSNLATWVTRECRNMSRPIPNAQLCPATMMALAFRESSWKPKAIGDRGEIGLFQIMPYSPAIAEVPVRLAQDPEVNTALAARWISVAVQTCTRSGWRRDPNFAERVLSSYGGAGCVKTPGARRALHWGRSIQVRRELGR